MPVQARDPPRIDNQLAIADPIEKIEEVDHLCAMRSKLGNPRWACW
jgi:hypothetical protein